jgi:hypothetical protein
LWVIPMLGAYSDMRSEIALNILQNITLAHTFKVISRPPDIMTMTSDNVVSSSEA